MLLGRLYEEPALLRELVLVAAPRLIVDDVELPRRMTSSLPVRGDDERTAPDCETPVRSPVMTRTDELRAALETSVRDDDDVVPWRDDDVVPRPALRLSCVPRREAGSDA